MPSTDICACNSAHGASCIMSLSQVMENYGHANHVLVLYHGFSLGRENRYDCVWIAPTRLPRGPGHGLMLARMREVRVLPHGCVGVFVFVCLCVCVLACLRLCVFR